MEDELFEEFYAVGFERVFRATLVSCGDRSLAEDAAQEAFARALERWDHLCAEPWALGWVMTTAMNFARRAHRPPPSTGISFGPHQVDLDASIDLWRAVRSLPRRQQEALALAYVADLPLEQAARVMGCKVGTVKVHMWRARQAIARLGVVSQFESG